MEAAAVNIAKAKELKAQGNEAFKAGNYNAAMVHYHQIFMYVHGFSEGSGASAQSMPGQTTKPVDAETMAQLRELKVVHFSNLAMCHLKLGNVEKARDNSSKALAIDAKNIKSLFRRGKCHSTLGALDEAKADFDQILSLEVRSRTHATRCSRQQSTACPPSCHPGAAGEPRGDAGAARAEAKVQGARQEGEEEICRHV